MKIAHEGRFGSVEAKIRHIASQFKDCEYMFADYSQANVEFDKVKSPTILYALPMSGQMRIRKDAAIDKPYVMLWFLCPADFDFDGEENECRVEAMKRLGIRFIDAINKSGLFEYVEYIPYQVAYDSYDDNLTGVCFTPTLEERHGISLCNGEYSRAWEVLKEMDK